MILNWNPKTTKPEVRDILRTLAEEYPLKESAQNVNLILEKNDEPNVLRVTRRGEVWFVSYGRDSLAARGVAYALSAQECDEKMSFKTFGILFDCTRGNVITVKHFKHWLRRLALMGYNLAMIYTKDAYQLPDEPYFGYMRGAYSLDELKEIDAYAKKLRIEMIGSIQVLGHLEPILRWGAYHQVRDTSSAIMVDEPETYELVEKMIKFWSEAFSSRRIHLGMDECQDLGRGRFMNEHGYESQFDLYNRHLGRVSKICDKFKLEPIIWSDMYFRYANAKQEYYDTKSRIPDEVKKAIPKNVRFSYWDYYHREPEIYESMLARTGELNGTKPIMASGVWTWKRFWTDYEMTGATVRPCIRACRKTGTDELIFTLWGDDGGYCEFDSAFAALAWAADYASNEKENEDRAAKLFEAVCGTSYRLQMICGALCYTYNGSQDKIVKILPGPLLWDDPLMGIARREFPAYKPELAETLLAGYRKIMELTGPGGHGGRSPQFRLESRQCAGAETGTAQNARTRLRQARFQHARNHRRTLRARPHRRDRRSAGSVPGPVETQLQILRARTHADPAGRSLRKIPRTGTRARRIRRGRDRLHPRTGSRSADPGGDPRHLSRSSDRKFLYLRRRRS